MKWESLLKVGRIKVDPLIRKPAFRKALMDAADEVGPQFALREIHEPFLKIYKKELVERGIDDYAARMHVRRYSELNSFTPIAGRDFNLVGKENRIKIYEKR